VGDIHARLEWKSMRVTPLHDRVLVQRLEEDEQTVGGIIIPDTAKEKPQQGEILAVGRGTVNKKGQRVPLEVKVGDRILFGKYSQEITLDGEEFLILRQEEILAVLVGGATTSKTTAKGKTTIKATKIPTKAIKKRLTKK
jgi:chaperonin GroES